MAFAPHVAAVLSGGLATSLGLGWLARRPRARDVLLATRGWMLALGATVAVAAGLGGTYWLVRSLLAGAAAGPSLPSPLGLLVFGSLLGIPLALPAVVVAWNDVRAERAAALKKRDFVPTKDDRRAYAVDLVRQITELSDRPRDVRALIAGDGGRVLRLEGDIDAKEASRLVQAVRADLRELGFKRVEGGGGPGSWWEPV